MVQIETDGKGKNIYIAVDGVAAPYSAVKINGIDMPIPEGAFARIYLSDLPENGAYNLYITPSYPSLPASAGAFQLITAFVPLCVTARPVGL